MGAQCYSVNGETVLKDKYYCRDIKTTEMQNELSQFFTIRGEVSKSLVEDSISKIREVIEILNSIYKLRLHFSSLLIVYDSDPSSDLNYNLKTRLIDFDFFDIHEDSNTTDENNLKPLNNIVEILSRMI